MNLLRSDLLLYAVTDRHWLHLAPPACATLEMQVAEALAGGATMVQLREKDALFADFLRTALEIKRVTDSFGVPLVINDDLDVALASGADGLHIGQSDGDPALLRRSLGAGRILGVSVATVEQALAAETAGADYLGVGAIFPTDTKGDASAITVQFLTAICSSVQIPVVAIGGITAGNVPTLGGTGIAGIAVVSALFGAPESVRSNAVELREAMKEICEQ